MAVDRSTGDRTVASYVALHRSGELRRRAETAVADLASCRVCPRRCGVDRLSRATGKELGFCRTGRYARVASFGPHYGEEAPLVGQGGSGAIFFSRCNLDCVYCQNWDISHQDAGDELGPKEIATIMLRLQRIGCENINLVSPSHVVPQILEALDVAASAGLTLPLVYNTGGYDTVETLKLLDDVVDIYMPDAKYADEDTAANLSGVRDYVAFNRGALREMYRQVGDLLMDTRGVAVRGLLVRHLVLPGGLAGTKEVMDFLAQELLPGTYVNVMNQYRPAGLAGRYTGLDRRPTIRECREAAEAARAAGLYRLDR
ncbi:MAG: radical SAM protein [Actinobacteria bacterium]|nr:radical SAM protein [Actinomycetota bacterium]